MDGRQKNGKGGLPECGHTSLEICASMPIEAYGDPWRPDALDYREVFKRTFVQPPCSSILFLEAWNATIFTSLRKGQ